MFNEIWMRRATWTCSVALVLLSGAWVQAQDADKKESQRRVLVLSDDEQVRQIKPSDYWVGLECHPVDARLRSHLDLPEETGLIIEQVLPESPAAKAGFKQYDVALKAGEKTLKSVADLMAAVDEAKDNALDVQVIRGGKNITIQVTPARRPEGGAVRRVETPDKEDLLELLLEKGKAAGMGDLRFRVLQPGAMLNVTPPARLPKDLTITVTRKGDEPAKVTVKKRDQTWEVVEGKLDDLPADVRPHVERMLGAGPRVMAYPPAGLPGWRGTPQREPGATGEPGKRFEIRRYESKSDAATGDLKQISEQIERLRKQLDDLQRSLPKPEKPAGKTKVEEKKPVKAANPGPEQQSTKA